MNKKDIEKAIATMQAYIDGKPIEYCQIGDLDGDWKFTKKPVFDWSKYTYRTRVASNGYRPFKNPEECLAEMLKHPPFGWLKNYETQECSHIETISYTDNEIWIDDKNLEYDEMLENYTFLDESPFGIKEK